MVGVRNSRWSVRGASLLVLALVSSASARTAVLKDRAKMREGPSAQTAVRAELTAGTHVEIKSDSGGWREVETPDGKTGYLWAEHLTEAEADPETASTVAAAAEPVRRNDAGDRPTESGSPRGVTDEVRALRADVTALREHPEPASAADLERVRAELERLAAADRDLTRRIEERGVAMPVTRDSGAEPLPGGSVLFLGVGALVGWAASRLAQRRRDRRQRNRIRL
jgi:hypothetical protein